MSNYQYLIVGFYNISIGNVKNMVHNLFDKENWVLHYENLKLYLRLGLKLKNICHLLEFNQPQWLKLYAEFNTKKNRSRKNG